MARSAAGTTPALRPSSRKELEQFRKGVVAVGPSGSAYRVRQLNPQRHILTGGLPMRLRNLAKMNDKEISGAVMGAEKEGQSDDARGMLEYMDNVVLAVIMEPPLTVEDLGSGEFSDDPLLPPLDYTWAFNIGQMRENRDGEGRLLWGKEPLSRFQSFRDAHGCDEDCEDCGALQLQWTAAIAATA